ncbi:MAG: hypothetical protein PF795_11620 [Kiritimatiellae bacterium]|nr:hypothetical protein [Kiritimatiellia bacterium]
MVGSALVVWLGYSLAVELVYLREARAMLGDWGLPVTFDHWRLIRPIFSERTLPSIPEGPAVEDFAPGIPYSQVTDGGRIQLGVYIESREWWDSREARIQTLRLRAKRSGVELIALRDLESLEHAMQHFELVIFSGHSNLGQGLCVWSAERGEDVLLTVEEADVVPDFPEQHRMTEERFPPVEFPKLKAPVFFHIGCRSGVYYSKAFQAQFPDTGFVFTHYEWGPGDQLVQMLDILCAGLEHRRPLSDVLKNWEQLFLVQHIQGRGREHRKYPSDSPFASRLFRWEKPTGL